MDTTDTRFACHIGPVCCYCGMPEGHEYGCPLGSTPGARLPKQSRRLAEEQPSGVRLRLVSSHP